MLVINGNNLTLEELSDVAYRFKKVELSEDCIERVIKCRNFVEKIIRENRTVYGLTTGFGKFSNIRISSDKLETLQENLILSHATGIGNNLSIPETRAILLLRINVLAKGHSGICLETLQTLIAMLNQRIHPCIPEKGSVGASGDLAPLSHLALVLLGKGKAELNGEILPGNIALERCGIKPVILKAKEGLALNNGTQVMTGIAALTLLQAELLCKQADICAALSVDSLLATPSAFDPLLHQLRPYSGQLISAKNLTNLLQNSNLRNSHQNCENVQDVYSLRCSPQVHGAVREALRFVRSILETELNSATDNPLIFPDVEKVISGGNFHGEPVAFAADILGFTVSELANISERRIEQLLNPALNRGLSPFLAHQPGLDSGFMIAQLTAAALVSENKVLAHPASVDSIPTSANQEDHVSMGTIGAVKARTMIENTSYVLAIELMCAVQALDTRLEKTSPVLESIKKRIRCDVPVLEKDRYINDDIHAIQLMVKSGLLVDIANTFILLG
jgi:histidine ammonia-lyase